MQVDPNRDYRSDLLEIMQGIFGPRFDDTRYWEVVEDRYKAPNQGLALVILERIEDIPQAELTRKRMMDTVMWARAAQTKHFDDYRKAMGIWGRKGRER